MEPENGRSTESTVSITPATWRDVGAVTELGKVAFGSDAWSWLGVLEALALPGTVARKAELNGRVVGFVIGDRRWERDLGWIASIAVHPDYRRRGVGRELLEVCERELGRPRVRLTLRRSNLSALRLYQHEGYVEVDVWRRYYADGEDGLVMEKRMAPPSF